MCEGIFMKKAFYGIACFLAVFFLFCSPEVQAQNDKEERILDGIFVEDMSLSGKTVKEAKDMVDSYVESLLTRSITLKTVNGNEVTITPADVGFSWSNQEIVEEAARVGKSGNIVQRYKAEKDLQAENKRYELEFQVEEALVRHVLADQCSVYNVEAENATLSREGEAFVIHEGRIGYKVEEDESLALIDSFLTGQWNGEDTSLELVIVVDEPLGTKEELSKVKDVLGTFSTSFRTSGQSRSANVRNGCELINGTTLYPGEEFSTYEAVAPFSAANGYYMAGSYLNGQVVDSIGGGICQVSTTLYNAVLLSELEVTERHNHSMIVTYVDPSADAAIAESSGKDFRFVNNTGAPIYIEGYTTDDKRIGFTIYGCETRDSSHSVAYESEVISKTYPDTEVVYTSASSPVGYVSVQSAHVGYKANLWKVVYENGQEVSREMINSSVYRMAPRSATVGVATADPNAYNQIMAAIATNNIDHIKNVAAALAAGTPPPAPPQETAGDPAQQPAGDGTANPAAGQGADPAQGTLPAQPEAPAQPADPAAPAPETPPVQETPAQ